MKSTSPIISMNDRRSKFFKVLNAANYESGYEFHDGLNDVSKFLNLDGMNYYCFFTDIEHIFAYLDNGPCFREIQIPEGTKVQRKTLKDNTPIYFSNKAILGPVKTFTVDTIKELISLGADISTDNYAIVRWALQNNFEVFYFLQDYISDYSDIIWFRIILDLEYRGYFSQPI